MSNIYDERIAALRALMAEKGVDYYLIPTADFHNSEYVHAHFTCREFMCGFSGSNGTMLVSRDTARIWTDGRYFIQCAKEIAGSQTILMKMAEPGVPTINEFLKEHMKAGQTLGFDGRCFTGADLEEFQKNLPGISFHMEDDLVDLIWEDRPAIPSEPLFYIPDELAGQSITEKLAAVREKMEDCDGYFLAKLDDIMWLYNIRGNDIECNPVALSYTYVGKDKAVLFLQKQADASAVTEPLTKAGIEIRDYDEVFDFLKSLPAAKVLCDKSETSARAYGILAEKCEMKDAMNPTTILKACKNPVELKNIREFYLKDSVALTKFIYWLKKYPDKKELTEYTAAKKLDTMRSEIPGFIELSFDTISAYKENAAMMHYSATAESASALDAKSFLLVDSGGQYMGATTDVTRTISLGELSEEERKHYTLVALSTLDLSEAKFLHGCAGINLDVLARIRLWKEGIDYKCGTGHGIGYILNVHEGPQSIRWKITPDRPLFTLEEGMILSDEPGVYRENKYGIRIENILYVVKDVKTDDGQFLAFQDLTFAPLDRAALNKDYMNNKELEMVNRYQKKVYDAVSPYLNEEERAWLQEECRPL